MINSISLCDMWTLVTIKHGNRYNLIAYKNNEEEEREFDLPPNSRISKAIISSSSPYIVAAIDEKLNALLIFDINNGELLRSINAESLVGECRGITISPNGELLAILGCAKVVVLSTSNWEISNIYSAGIGLSQPPCPFSFCFAPNSDFVYIGYSSGELLRWRISDFNSMLHVRTHSRYDSTVINVNPPASGYVEDPNVHINPIFVATFCGEVSVLDADTGETMRMLENEHRFNDAFIIVKPVGNQGTPDSDYILVHRSDSTRLINARSGGQTMATLPDADSYGLTCVDCSPNGEFIGLGYRSNKVKLMRTEWFREYRTLNT